MKLIASVVALLWACAATAFGATSNNLIPLGTHFTEDGKVIREKSRSPEGVKETVREEGAKDGTKYRFYYSDGSGAISGDKENDISYLRYPSKNWSVSCKKDVMNDKASCFAVRDGFFVFYSEASGYIVGVNGDKYPQSLVSVRVNSGTVISATESRGFTKDQSEKILKSIKDGSSLATRYIDWPYKSNKDSVSKVYGVGVVQEYLKWAVESIK